MSSLKPADKILIETFLEMQGGHVCDFTDNSFKSFVFENTNVDIYKPGYEVNGTSKANRLRLFLVKEPGHLVKRLLKELLLYWKTVKEVSQKKFGDEDQVLYKRCLEAVENLADTKKINGVYDLEKVLIKILLSKGYPEDSLFLGWSDGLVIFNLAVVEPVSGMPLAVFELDVSSPVIVTTDRVKEIISKYQKITTNSKVPLYVVHTVLGASLFSVTKILYQTKTASIPHYLEVKDFLTFEELKGVVLGSKTDLVAIKQEGSSSIEKVISKLKFGTQEGSNITIQVGGNLTMQDNNLVAKARDSKESKHWLTMENPLVYIGVVVVVAVVLSWFNLST